MNRKWIYAFVAALILIVLVVVFRQSDTPNTKPIASSQDQPAEQENDNEPVGGNEPATPVPGATSSKSIDTEHKENVRKGLEAIVEGLKKMGATEVPPIADQLKAAVTSGDSGTMLRAFNEAIYGRFAKMSEAIPAIKPYLNTTEPYVRYLAAETLLRVGDPSGIETLLRLVERDDAVSQGTRDLRLAAATALSTFSATKAAESIRGLYSRTKEGEALDALVTLGFRPVGADSWPFVSGALAIEGYAKVGSTKFVPHITETFEKNNDPATKSAAAWALARMTGSEQYVSVLSEAARPAIERKEKGGLSYDDSTKALKYLGSVQSPQAVKVLEQALDSQNPVAVQYATVNLLFNQPGGSQKAEQLIVREFETSPQMLGTDLAMQIASKSYNPKVRAAARSFATRTGSDRWRYWGVERADWPVQNWIYDYTVTLNP
jgi:HEAT repeat protein